MANSSQNYVHPGKIPILFDIVERGKNAPKENLMKPPPPPEKTEFKLGGPEAGSEDPTVLPGNQAKEQPADLEYDELMNADTVETAFLTEEMLQENSSEPKIDPAEATQENPAIQAEQDLARFKLDSEEKTLDNPAVQHLKNQGESVKFTLADDDAITAETPTEPASMTIDSTPSSDELVEQVAEKLMPRLEELMRDTVKQALQDKSADENTDNDDSSEKD